LPWLVRSCATSTESPGDPEPVGELCNAIEDIYSGIA
jgi:hypothetical protein